MNLSLYEKTINEEKEACNTNIFLEDSLVCTNEN